MLVPLNNRCSLYTAGHNAHFIQARLAREAAAPRQMIIVGEVENGVLVVPPGGPDHVEVWCMHREGLEAVREAQGRGINFALAYEHSYAEVGGQPVSRTTPELWVPCREVESEEHKSKEHWDE